jgi:hypothetical protein
MSIPSSAPATQAGPSQDTSKASSVEKTTAEKDAEKAKADAAAAKTSPAAAK